MDLIDESEHYINWIATFFVQRFSNIRTGTIYLITKNIKNDVLVAVVICLNI